MNTETAAPADQFSIFSTGQVTPPPAAPKIPQAEVEKSKKLGDFLVKPLDSLVADDSFDPVAAYRNNEFGDSEDAKKKILEVFKARELAGTSLGKIAVGAIKGVAGLPRAVADAGGTIASEVVNAVEGVKNGNPDRTASALGTLGAGVHTNVQQLLGTVERGVPKLLPGLDKTPQTDEQWERRIKHLAQLQTNVEDATKGDIGGIREATEKAGGQVNPEEAQTASTLLDPTLLIPLAAGLKSARAVEGAAQVASKGIFTKAAEAAASGAKNAAATVFDKAGAVATVVGDTAAAARGSLPGAIIGGIEGGLHGGPIGALAGAAGATVAPRVIQKAGQVLSETAGKLRGTIPPGPIWKAVAAAADNEVTRGAAKGAAAGLGLTGDPLAGAFTALGVAGAENDEQRGAALGGQAAFGAAPAAVIGAGRAIHPFFDIAGQVYDPKAPSKPVASPDYGTASAADAAHREAISKLDPDVQNRINQFREALRTRGAEIYVLDQSNFGKGVEQFFAQEAERAKGAKLTNEELAFVRDQAQQAGDAQGLFVNEFNLGGQKKKVVFLNSDGSALQHEGGHLLFSLLSPEERASLISEVGKRYTPEELTQFKNDYEDRLGRPISDTELHNEVLAENISAILNAVPVETLGTPKPLARSIYQGLGKLFETLGVGTDRTTDLGLRTDFGLGQLSENVLRAQEAGARPPLQSVQKVDLTKVPLEAAAPKDSKAPLVPAKATPEVTPNVTPEAAGQGGQVPPAKPPAPPASGGATPPPGGGNDANIRVGRDDQNAFRREATDKELSAVAKAVDANPAYGPAQKEAFVKLGAVISQGGDRPRPVEVDYRAAESGEFRAGRSDRRGEQSKTYAAEAAGALPEEVRQLTQKVLIPDRFEVRSGNEVQLVAKSLDKIVANAYLLSKDAHANGVEALVPYASKDGALAPESWKDLVKDIQTYTANQSNGYAGNGSAVIAPAGYKGEIPAVNSQYKPTRLPDNKADFINMLMALPPPKTTSKVGVTKSGTPANLIARDLATANGKVPLESITSTVGKNVFENGKRIAEFNPLRDQMAKAGVDVRDLLEVTERVNLKHITGKVEVRNDLDLSRPSTDLIRAGFKPDPKKPTRTSSPEVTKIAEDYNKANGIGQRLFKGYEKISPELGTRIADWFEKAKSEPNSPEVVKAYDALGKETRKQYDALVDAGYKIEPWNETSGEPYKSSADAVADVRDNKHLWYFKTDNAFGHGGFDVSSNPLLKPSGVEINGQPVPVNDLFRAVHDFFGHAKEGYEFGPRGEYNAFLAHSTMFSPEALPALAAETLAQNSWVNFGKHLRREDGSFPVKGDADYLPLQNRPFADQKTLVVPPDILKEALRPTEPVHPEKAAGIEKALADPDTSYKYSVWDREMVPPGQSRVRQIDLISPNIPEEGIGDRSYGSTNLDELRRFGKDLPDAPESLPPGQYTLDEIKAANAAEVPAGSFKPKKDNTAEMDLGEAFSPEKLAAKAAKTRIADKKNTFPESLPVTYVKNEDGSLRLDEDNKPQTVKLGYDLYDTPLAKAAAKGIRGDEARQSAVADAYADKLFEEYERVEKTPEIAAGASWYQTARTKIKEVFGDDSLLFAQLLGATSARTPVADNFRQSIDAYRKFKAGDYDKIVKKYQQGLAKLEDGSLMKDSGKDTEAAALDWWVQKHDLVPRKSNGQRFNANSMQVLKVLAGTWADTVGGPKTPNFAGNLAGTTLAATIDVWAARGLRRLASEPGSRWRILPESETGVSDPDFFLGQAAYERAAAKIGINPDDLQGVLWFAEKDFWEKQGWTRGSGAEKSDFNTFLKKTSRDGDTVVLDESEANKQPELF